MRYFVTGATGFIGRVLARQLRDAGHQVVALVRDPTKADALKALGVELHRGDIVDRDSLITPMTGADGVFHLAAWYQVGVKAPHVEGERINVEGTRNVLEVMRELRVKKGVYTSSLAVFSDTHGRVVDETYRHDGPWLSEYDRTKWKAHYEVALPMIQQGLPLVIVQPGVVYGPGDTSSMHTTFIDYLRGRLPALPRETQFCWQHVEDAARAHVLAMEKGKAGEAYVVAGPVHKLTEVFEVAERITGKKAPRMHLPTGAMRAMAAAMRPLAAMFPVPATYHPETLRVAAGTTYIATNAKARRDLGFVPRPIEDGLREYLLGEMKRLGATT